MSSGVLDWEGLLAVASVVWFTGLVALASLAFVEAWRRR